MILMKNSAKILEINAANEYLNKNGYMHYELGKRS